MSDVDMSPSTVEPTKSDDHKMPPVRDLYDNANANANDKLQSFKFDESSFTLSSIPFGRIFKTCTGYDTHHFTNLMNFTQWLHRPVDASALGVFRLLYGVTMLIDIAEERGGSQLDVRFGEERHCHFPLFDGIRAFSFPVMGCVYLVMWLGAIGITLGYRYRFSCLAFIGPYWYIFLLDKPAWNNHSYLFGLVGSLMLFTKANHYLSLDKHFNPSLSDTVPYWNYFIIKFQFFILYMYAGLKKFTAEWLSGYAMSSLSRHWVFAPFHAVLSPDLIDLFIVHWFAAIFDFSIAFFMICEKTRLLATPFMLSFHLMNSQLFVIGMFPWVCLAQVPLFYSFDWPRKLSLRKCGQISTKTIELEPQKPQKPQEPQGTVTMPPMTHGPMDGTDGEAKSKSETDLYSACRKAMRQSKIMVIDRSKYLRTIAIVAYCCLQLFLPYSHFITQGYNNWTNGLYGYSWDMMVHSYDTILTSIKIVDNSNNNIFHLNPYAFTEYNRWTKYADMALQYAKCIERNIIDEFASDPFHSPLSSTNFSIYFDIWCSMNGRFQQRVFDPRVDLLRARWSPFERTAWSLPLLTELNHMRPKLKTITNEVLAWNNYSDVIFVADFPGLTLDNFITPDLTNITLTILEGNVRYRSDDDDEAYFLTAGKSIGLPANVTHHITTIGLKPSCYLYTYVNKTMLDAKTVIDDVDRAVKPMLPLWREFKERAMNYMKFLNHIINCILYLLYKVPIPMAVRDID